MIWRWSWEVDALITIVIFWIVGLMLLFIVPRNRKPSSATAWLLLMYVIPLLGLIIFFLIGSPKLSKRRRAMQHTMNDTIAKAVAEAQSHDEFDSLLEPPIPAASQTRRGFERSEEHTSELQSHSDLVCRLLLATKKSSGPAAGPNLFLTHHTTP